MPRARIVATVSSTSAINGVLRAVSNADSVAITNHETGSPVSVYAAASGGSALTAPFTTDDFGRVIDEAAAELWADPQNLSIVATKGGDTYTIFYPLLSAFVLDSLSTLEELVAGVRLGDISATAGSAVFVAPFACNIAQVSLVSESAVVANATDLWTVDVKSYRAGAVRGTIASKTSNEEAVTANQDWNLDAATFDATYKALVKGDVVRLELTKGGTAATLTDLFAQVRYEPI